jgi:hypothetical protein
MEPRDTGVTPPPPHLHRGLDPSQVVTRIEVEAIVDTRIRMYEDERRRIDDAARVSTAKQRLMTYGLGGIAGLMTGITGTIIVQRMRRGRGGGGMKP